MATIIHFSGLRVARARHMRQPWATHFTVLHHLCQPQHKKSKCLSCKGHREQRQKVLLKGVIYSQLGFGYCWFNYWVVIFSQDPHRHRESTINNLFHKKRLFLLVDPTAKGWHLFTNPIVILILQQHLRSSKHLLDLLFHDTSGKQGVLELCAGGK